MKVNQKDFNLKAGQSCYLAPGDIHFINNMGDVDLEFLAVCTPAWVPDDSFDV